MGAEVTGRRNFSPIGEPPFSTATRCAWEGLAMANGKLDGTGARARLVWSEYGMLTHARKTDNRLGPVERLQDSFGI